MNRYEKIANDASDSPPSESWFYAQLILGKPIPQIVSTETKARAKRAQLEWLAQFSSRHAEDLRKLEAAEAKANYDRAILEYAAQISARAREKLCILQRKEARDRAAWCRAEQFYEAHCLSLTEGAPDQPRQPKGTPAGGQWAPKGGGHSDAGAVGEPQPYLAGGDQVSKSVPVTKSRLPADHRGTWISGTKGHGTFLFKDSLENQLAGLAGKEVRFDNQYIARGGFPPESYYGGSAHEATVEIDSVSGTYTDTLASDAAMRKKQADPNWQRPKGYRWNHAGGPGSRTMELVDEIHARVAHKGSGAGPRAPTLVAQQGA